MLDLQFISHVDERDIDLLLLEELRADAAFGRWFADRSGASHDATLGAWHSVCDADGESDLVFIFDDRSGSRESLLIENKISAAPQPDQAGRYRRRGERGLAAGHWSGFRTCLVAPQQYLDATTNALEYDARISYEQIAEQLLRAEATDARRRHRIELMRAAIEQHRRGYVAVIDERMTSFVHDYCALARAEFPDLRVQEAKPRPSTSTWIQFKPWGLPEGTALWHQTTGGAVKLFFNGAAGRVAELKARYGSLAAQGMPTEIAGKSVTISVPVPRLQPLDLTVGQQDAEIRRALDSAVKIANAVRAIDAAPS